MDKETFEILQQYDAQMRSLKETNFCRLPGSPTLKVLDECYRKIFNKGSKLLNGCSNCIYHSLKELSNAYYEYLDKVEAETEPNTVTVSHPIKSTRGRKPKVTNKE